MYIEDKMKTDICVKGRPVKPAPTVGGQSVKARNDWK